MYSWILVLSRKAVYVSKGSEDRNRLSTEKIFVYSLIIVFQIISALNKLEWIDLKVNELDVLTHVCLFNLK